MVLDIAQESFLRAYRQLGNLQHPAAFGAWLLRITHRCALDAVRRRPSEVPFRHLQDLAQRPYTLGTRSARFRNRVPESERNRYASLFAVAIHTSVPA